MRTGILGAGFTGRETGKLFTGQNIPVWGTTRSPDKFSDLQVSGISPVLFDGQIPERELLQQLADTTHLIISIAPPRDENTHTDALYTDPVLNALSTAPLTTLAPKLEWTGYLSTVGVYGNHNGAWVTETTTPAPVSARSRQRLRAEKEWLALGAEENLPVSIFRLSGIYGKGRNALRSATNGKTRRLIKKGQVFNRIHVADIAAALLLAARKKITGLYNITDNEPAPPQDVVTFAHDLTVTEPPEPLDFETADITPMARSFYGENKRVSNTKSKNELGMIYSYPDYRRALTRMWDEDNW